MRRPLLLVLLALAACSSLPKNTTTTSAAFTVNIDYGKREWTVRQIRAETTGNKLLTTLHVTLFDDTNQNGMFESNELLGLWSVDLGGDGSRRLSAKGNQSLTLADSADDFAHLRLEATMTFVDGTTETTSVDLGPPATD